MNILAIVGAILIVACVLLDSFNRFRNRQIDMFTVGLIGTLCVVAAWMF